MHYAGDEEAQVRAKDRAALMKSYGDEPTMEAIDSVESAYKRRKATPGNKESNRPLGKLGLKSII
jgi:hypothetical protein